MNNQRVVAVLGASAKAERYSYQAVRRLVAAGFQVRPINPGLKDIDGIPVVARLEDIKESLDTLTLYLSASRSSPLGDAIIACKPKRVIFNPGAENEDLELRLTAAGIKCLRACSLVLLSTGHF